MHKDAVPNAAPGPKRRPGRPALPPDQRVKTRRSKLTLDGPMPYYIGYGDLTHLIRLLRGAMYVEAQFKLWVEDGVIPSFIDTLAIGTAHAGVRRRKYHWPDVRAAIEKRMVPAEPAGIQVNGKFVPRTAVKAAG